MNKTCSMGRESVNRILQISSVSFLLFAGGCCCCFPLGSGTGGGGLGGADSDSELEIVGMTLTDGLKENQAPENEVDHFYADQPAYFSLKLKGRPKGKLKATIFVHDENAFEIESDLDELNGDTVFSIGQSTYWGITLEAGDNRVLPICEDCRVEVEHNGSPVAQYDFAIKSPKDAIATKIDNVTLCETFGVGGVPYHPTDTFAPSESICVFAEGSQGFANEVRARIYLSGEPASEFDHGYIPTKNAENAKIRLVLVSNEDWPTGEHEVAVMVNRKETGRYAITIDPEKKVTKVGDAHVLSMTFANELDEGGAASDEVKVFSPTKTSFFVLKLKGRPKGVLKALFFFEDEKFAEVENDMSRLGSADESDPALVTYANFNLSPSDKLPESSNYRLDIEYDGEPLASYPFEYGPQPNSPPVESDE